MTSTSNRQRYHDLDALRGFAMLLGLLLHAAMSFVALPITVNPTQDIYQDTPVYSWMMDAVHGFRMPLFFLVSGMFTAMLWQRRGKLALLKHRLFRIGVPLLVGVLTLAPAVILLNILLSRNIWFASAKGDLAYVQAYIDAGNSVDVPMEAETIPGHGGTPLHLAAARSQVAVVERLLAAKADVNARSRYSIEGQPSLATPLHWAASEAGPEMVQLLINQGADVNALDADGGTPTDYAAVKENSSVIDLLAEHGGLPGTEVQVSLPSDSIPQQQSAAEEANATSGRYIDYLGNWIRQSSLPIQLFALLSFFPACVHLWFLWYLLWLVCLFLIAASVVELLGIKPLPTWLFKSPFMWCWVWPPTVALQLLMVQTFGPDTASGLLPWPPILVYYGIFFGFGALYYCRPQTDYQIGTHYGLYLLTALAILPVGIYAIDSRHIDFYLYHAVAALVAATYAWLMILGLFGAFRAACPNENAWVRYVSDAAYWIYLIHLPIVQLLQIWMCDWQISSWLKIAIICVLTFGLTLLTYEYVVRYTWIGSVLHGRKHRQKQVANLETPNSQSLAQLR